MSECTYLTAPSLHTPHGFFTRQGGVSTGIYASLNCGLGSNDDAALVATNRQRASEALKVPYHSLINLHQIHSNTVITITNRDEYQTDNPAHADAAVTNQPDITLTILTADCCPVLFYDAAHQVIGAAHAGWKGAFSGILQNTVDAMIALGASKSTICAAIGPTIAQASYEVDHQFYERFITQSAGNAQFFIPSSTPDHYLFDLPAYNTASLKASGLTNIFDVQQDTYTNAQQFFSYRRTCHQHETNFGRLISMISLPPR